MGHKVDIKNSIYTIRSTQVMLDSDLADIFGCANGTKSITQAVKRNINKFPSEFCFKLSEKEVNVFWSQVGTKKILETRGGKYKTPYVFTEAGT